LDPALLLEPVLLASLAALLVGPLVFERVRGSWALAGLDAFALVAVGGLVALHILPLSFQLAGWKAAPVFLFGLFGPGFMCGTRILAGSSGSRVTLPLALFGIALHAVLDGVALTSGNALALAVILHRVSDGLGLWWLARPAYGRRVAAVLLGTLALFSVLGYVFAPPIVSGASHGWFALLQALIAGSLLHVILRHPPNVPREVSTRGTALVSGIGGLVGLALVLGLKIYAPDTAHGEHAGVGGLFLELALESAPALLAAYVAVALLHAWEIDLAGLLGRGKSLAQAVRGTLVGLPMPICSCGVIPLYRDLVLHGVPLPAALSFLMAAPELGVTAIFLSVSLLGVEITLVRAACAAVLALTVGLVVGRRAPVSEPLLPRTPRHERPPFAKRLAGGLRYGLGDMVDSTAPWILVGLAVAALLSPWLDTGSLARLPAGLDVPLFALIGMPLYVCASGSTPLVAVLLAKGVSPGAAIAFLLTGPATNLTTFGVLSRLHSRRTALVFAVTTALTTTALGWGANALLGDRSASVASMLHESHGGSWFESACALGLAALFVVSLLRQGTRAFVGQVISPHGASAAPHEHGDHGHGDHGDHGHEQGPHAHDEHGCCGVPARSH
jgi:uncharacterized membrane protein YraQ (UPF0718 family)